tara:strand:+ start:2107 stop:2238 length:132 start_codon:yes stop_codon:yes gene_type:complete
MCWERRDSVARGVWEVGGATELPSLKKRKKAEQARTLDALNCY